jgi:CheY-like chemotaxis protein
VRRLAEAMGGSVALDSGPGRGSTFSVELALAEAIQAPEGATRRVLVVDDDPVNRRVLARQLELSGLAADVARSGEDALRRWRAGCYGLVLADLQLPDIDGFTLACRIRALEAMEARSRTPILALTASAPDDASGRCRRAGLTLASQRLRLLFGDDPAALAEIADAFRRDAARLHRALRRGVDFIALARAAHRLKGAAGALDEPDYQAVADRIEQAALASDGVALARLRRELEALSDGRAA